MPRLEYYQTSKTIAIVVIKYLGNNQILTGNKKGEINLWCLELGHKDNVQMYHKFSYYCDSRIVFLAPYGADQFISSNVNGEVKIWEMHTGVIKKRISLEMESLDGFALLHDNLLAVSYYATTASEDVDVYDMDSGQCIHPEIVRFYRPHGVLLAITTNGLLVTSSCCGGEMKIYKITKEDFDLICETDIDRIYSMATLPGNMIVTAGHDITIYKLSLLGEINIYNTISNRNVIDAIFPIGGYQFLTVDRSRFDSGGLKLWNYLSSGCEYLGDSLDSGIPLEVVGRYNLIFSYERKKIIGKRFAKGTFRFPPKLAEIRKNARILAQADRTVGCHFSKILPEIKIKIVLMTVTDLNEYEKKISGEFAWCYFNRPNCFS